MNPPTTANRTWTPLSGVIAVFVISRVIYDLAGIRFQGDTYLGYWQFIDPLLLKTALWQSVIHLHSQPPLMNLFTGIILQVFPSSHVEVFHFLYFFAGLTLAISIYFLGYFMHFPTWLSLVLSAWFMINPGTVLYEHWLTYTYPIMVMMTMAGVCLYKFIATKKSRFGFGFFCLLGGIALSWSLFHIIWLYAILFLLLVCFPERKKVLLTALIPLVLVTGWYGKNYLLFDEFTASSWTGMNLSRITTFRLPEEDRSRMVKSGELSKFALILPFRNPSAYLKLLPDTPHTGIPVLDEPETSLGRRNHHHLVYVEASGHYLRDALDVIHKRPEIYVRSVLQALYIFFHSPSDFDLTRANQSRIGEFDLWWNRIFFGQWQNNEKSMDKNEDLSIRHVGLWIIVSFITAVAGIAIIFWRKRRFTADPGSLLLLFIVYNILYVTLVGNLADIGENNRFRSAIDPFLMLLFAFVVRNGILPAIKKDEPGKFKSTGSEQ